MDLKNAVAAWKKAKPLTLTKTGISEVLGTLPKDSSIVTDFKKEMAVVENVQKTIAKALTDKRVLAHKSAVACLKELLGAVEAKIKRDKELRGRVNEALKAIFEDGEAFLKKPSPEGVAQLKTKVKQLDQLYMFFKPSDHNYMQVPTRIVILADAYAKAIATKGNVEAAKKEMTQYLASHPVLVA